jgi:hypothetical protein
MTELLGPDGSPISSAKFAKKAPGPKVGDAFGPWSGRDLQFATLPGGSIVQFDLSKLTLADYRAMRDHYQVNASLAVLSFMQHQSDWKIECENPKIAKLADEMLREVWTPLNRSMSTANWAGYSPNVLQWDNVGSNVLVTKIKDLIPEECRVHWKITEGWAPEDHIKPKFKTFDGIRQWGQSWPTPVENSFWYPMLMENGDYYGRKLLRPAFQSWFFSILIHLFANRYYERFGEPTPIGRAPFDDDIMVDGKPVKGNVYMLSLLQQLRNRGVVTLPSEKVQNANGSVDYEYDISYLESQMRGADFERYLTRLDEEISIGLFTPILLLRTADVGSYNLGQGHMQVYLWMLNAMNEDRAFYINNYILGPMADYNFGLNAPRPKIKFRKMDQTDKEIIHNLMTSLVNSGLAMPDLDQLGEIAGMKINEIKQMTAPDPASTLVDPNADPNQPTPAVGPKGKGGTGGTTGGTTANRAAISTVAGEMVARVRPQVERAFDSGEFKAGWMPDFGFNRRMERALGSEFATNDLYMRLGAWAGDAISIGADQYNGPDDFMRMFTTVLDSEIERVSGA